MDEISLCPMTRELCHAFFQGFENDPALCADSSQCTPYVYSEEGADRYFDKQQRPDRLNLAVSYALHVLGLTAVNADTLVGNVRSQHVLEKIGFRFLRREGDFKYYRYEA